jgi:hypothetical protein
LFEPSLYFGPFICRAYDQAAIKFRGVNADINFALDDYKDEMKKVIPYYNLQLKKNSRSSPPS